MMSQVVLRTAAFGLTTLLLACGGGGDGDPSDPDDDPFTGTVHILDNRFSPASITISAGDSVTWVWEGNNSHTLTQGTSPDPSEDPTRLFDVPERKNGTFGYRFMTAGTVPYFCRKHFYMSMDGTVTIKP
jgi:plastocyanin